jgi:hypothetical protein
MRNRAEKDRNFGIVVSIFFTVLGVRSLLNGSAPGYWLLFFAVIFLFTSLVTPGLLHPVNRTWTGLGLLMGRIMTPVVMLIIYIVAVLPTAVVTRILGRDPLLREKNRDAHSYWVVRSDATALPGSMKNQF